MMKMKCSKKLLQAGNYVACIAHKLMTQSVLIIVRKVITGYLVTANITTKVYDRQVVLRIQFILPVSAYNFNIWFMTDLFTRRLKTKCMFMRNGPSLNKRIFFSIYFYCVNNFQNIQCHPVISFDYIQQEKIRVNCGYFLVQIRQSCILLSLWCHITSAKLWEKSELQSMI